MAMAGKPLTFALAAVAVPGTSVAPSSPVPDNCTGVLVLNTSTTLSGLVGTGTAPTALVAGTNATELPPGASVTLPIGALAQRGPMDEAQLAGSGLLFDAIGGAVTFDITYLNEVGAG